MTGVASLGIGVLQQGGNNSERRVALPPGYFLREPLAVATAAFPSARLSPCAATAEDGSPGPYVLFRNFWVQSRAGLLPAPGCGDGEGRLLARRHLTPPGNTVDQPDPGYANRTAEGYLHLHAAVCARHRAISCTRRHSASSRIGSDTTATADTNVANSPVPPPPCVSRELEYEGYVEMPGRTRGETRALRDASREYAHRHGLPLDHAAMVSMLAKGEATNEIIRLHGASKDSPDLPIAHASDLPTPNNVSDVEKSPHTGNIWLHSMHQESNGILQAGTFAPTPA